MLNTSRTKDWCPKTYTEFTETRHLDMCLSTVTSDDHVFVTLCCASYVLTVVDSAHSYFSLSFFTPFSLINSTTISTIMVDLNHDSLVQNDSNGSTTVNGVDGSATSNEAIASGSGLATSAANLKNNTSNQGSIGPTDPSGGRHRTPPRDLNQPSVLSLLTTPQFRLRRSKLLSMTSKVAERNKLLQPGEPPIPYPTMDDMSDTELDPKPVSTSTKASPDSLTQSLPPSSNTSPVSVTTPLPVTFVPKADSVVDFSSTIAQPIPPQFYLDAERSQYIPFHFLTNAKMHEYSSGKYPAKIRTEFGVDNTRITVFNLEKAGELVISCEEFRQAYPRWIEIHKEFWSRGNVLRPAQWEKFFRDVTSHDVFSNDFQAMLEFVIFIKNRYIVTPFDFEESKPWTLFLPFIVGRQHRQPALPPRSFSNRSDNTASAPGPTRTPHSSNRFDPTAKPSSSKFPSGNGGPAPPASCIICSGEHKAATCTATHTVRGRPVVSSYSAVDKSVHLASNGKALCTHFNISRKCSRPTCSYGHYCGTCGSTKHGASECTN
jgi:hypothetical protein